jgi:predicted transcriptional regulator
MPTGKYNAVPPPLHELESEAMEEIWRLGEGTVRDVLEALNRRAKKARAYTTVMTVMARLDRKGLLTRRLRDPKTYLYTPAMSRDEYLEARARAEVEALVEQYGDLALVSFTREVQQLDPKRREQLRRLARRD